MTEQRFDHEPFRPLRPLTAADTELFFGRGAETTALAERLMASTPGALLLGESGVGKTSLLRAGLLPALESRGASYTWVEGRDLELAAHLPEGPPGQLLIVDDAGAVLDGGAGQERLERLLREALDGPDRKVILVLDDADLWRLEGLDGALGHSLATAARLRLERLDRTRAAEVIERTALAGGGFLESGLAEALAADLTRPGPVLPATLQLVAGEVVARRLSTRRAYARSGGPEVITWRFFERACAAAGGARARRVLAVLAAAAPHRPVTVEELARETGLEDTAVEALLSAWAELDVAQVTTAPGNASARLATEWLRPLARAFTGEEQARGLTARLLLKRKVDRHGLLLPWQLREVRRHAGALGPDEHALVRRSRRVLAAAAAVLVVVPLALFVYLYGAAGRAYHFDLDGQGPGARIVSRRGPPHGHLAWMPHRPPLGTVIADSGFLRAALRDPRPPAGGRVGEDPVPRLAAALRPLPRAALALVVDGDAKPLTAAFADPALRPRVVEVIGLVGRGTAEEQALLATALADESEEVRQLTVRAAAALEQRAAGAGAPVLQAAVQGAAPATRALALAEIARLPDGAAAALLTELLQAAAEPAGAQPALHALEARAGHSPAAVQSLAAALRGPARAAAAAALARLLATAGPTVAPAERAIAEVALDAAAEPEARIAALGLLRHRPVAGIEAITGPPTVLVAALPLIARARPDAAGAKVAEAVGGTVEQRVAAATALASLPPTADTRKFLKALENDPFSDVRCAAVRALPVLGRPAAGLLAHDLQAGDAATQQAAITTLAANARALGFGTVAAVLGAATRRGGSATRIAAAAGLGGIAERDPRVVVAQLRGALRAKDPGVRAAAAAALGEALAHGAKQAVPLLRALAQDEDPGPRRQAARSLARAAPALAPAATQALVAFVVDRDAAVRAEVATSLGVLGAAHAEVAGPLGQLVRDQEPQVATAARLAARRLGPAAGDLDAVLTAGLAATTPATTIDVARTTGPVGALGALRRALADPEVAVRRAAAECFGSLDAAATDVMVGALGDPDEQVRTAALDGLVRLKAVGPLARAAHSPDAALREAALAALPELGPAAARPVIAAALGDGSERVRAAAVRSLAVLACAGTATLRQALHDPAADVRLAAAAALGRASCDSPLAALVAGLHDQTDADARFAAGFELAQRAAAPDGAPARKALDDAATRGAPTVRLTARVARAFVGRPDQMARFVRLLRAAE